ncbi:secretory phospholipase A2 receptor isoform X3 [Crotalus tigris]|uniref:secretory phospholipase A2 receptor isoform X3 n=1 Tax=Crotalus tigris TaxID=88082 RepID=UPI00192F48B1|nr:secretory phospholipase A2 receptor isoform X3 [Crotalus tigris]
MLGAMFPLACSMLVVCSCLAERELAALTQDQLPYFLRKGIFIIQSENLSTCITAETSELILENCNQVSKHMLWKWGSKQQLFNIGRSRCLGLNLSNPEPSLVMTQCDSPRYLLQWRCHGKALIGASQFKLAVENSRFIVVKRISNYGWKQFMSHDDLCEHAFEEMYTLLGNSLGLPCVFPFKHNNKWHYECIRDFREDGYPWCATTSHYEQDEKWGLCPNSGSGCDIFWKINADTQICYQINLLSVLSWNEARVACQGQGADLLSITDMKEQEYIGGLIEQLNTKEAMIWTGLNQLDETAGWQWSDGAPLALVNWLKGSWKFYPTICDSNWYPHNNYCYKLHKEEKNWNEAFFSCQDDNSTLISITSLADTEMLINLLQYENVTDTWIGLSCNKTPVDFEWSDGSAVIFTYWNKQEPNILQKKGQICVSAQQHEGRWKIKNCKSRYFYICKRRGNIGNHISEVESGCPEGWERHGAYCYKVDTIPRSFEHASNGYYCPSLATITSRFEQGFLNSMIHHQGNTDSPYFWIALQDLNNTGEYTWLTEDRKHHLAIYTNWRKYQPRYPGGCVVIRQEEPIGMWEVKNCATFMAKSLCKQEASFHEKSDSNKQPNYEESFNSCMRGWESDHYLLNCYKIICIKKVFHSEKVLMKRTWEEAETLCQDFGAHLASFKQVLEEEFLNKLLNTMFHIDDERQFWIGFSKRNPLSGRSWEWSDGTPVSSAFLEKASIEDNVKNCAAYKTNGTVLPLHCNSEHEWICKIPKGVKPKTPQWYINELPWFYYQGAEYLFYGSPSNWDSFQFVCGWLRGDIATIQSSQEQEFIQNRIKKISKKSSNWWIALRSELPSEEFRWTDGSLLSYQNWAGDQERPKPAQGPKCAFISSQTGQWGFANCTISLPCICKRQNVQITEREILKEEYQGTCPKGWLYFGFKCFLVQIPKDSAHLKSWHSAQKTCSYYDASLVSVENEVEQAFIAMNLLGHKSNVWIGLQSDSYEKWLNGQQMEYANWFPAQNHYIGDTEKKDVLCTSILNNPSFSLMGKWYLESCENKNGFVCQKVQDTSRHIIDPSVMYPIPDTLEYANSTYTLINGSMTWNMASQMCKKNGAELVSITDYYHQAFLTVIINRVGYAHWIGLFTSDDGLPFEWSDGTRPFFTFWGEEETQSPGHCAYIDTNGHWKNTDCEKLLSGAICHISPKNKSMENKELCVEKTVPWIRFDRNCYSFSTVFENLNFYEALEFCSRQDSNLLTIKGRDENIFILEELHSFGSVVEMIWLNTHFLMDNATVIWLDGSPVQYSNWGTEQPEVGQRKDNSCIVLTTADGIWKLLPCHEKKGFVCKAKTGYHETAVPPAKVSYPRIVILVILSALLIAVSAIVKCLWWPSRISRTTMCFRNACLGEAHSEVPVAEESILISNLERNDVHNATSSI